MEMRHRKTRKLELPGLSLHHFHKQNAKSFIQERRISKHWSRAVEQREANEPTSLLFMANENRARRIELFESET